MSRTNRCLRSCLISTGSHSPSAGARRASPAISIRRATCGSSSPVCSMTATSWRSHNRFHVLLNGYHMHDGGRFHRVKTVPAAVFFFTSPRVSPPPGPDLGFFHFKKEEGPQL